MTPLTNLLNKKIHINCNGRLLDMSTPKVMGILNITPDSFYDGGKYNAKSHIKAHVDSMIAHGVDIIDVGAYSSRPGADDVTEKEELSRLCNALDVIRQSYEEIIISVDTFRSNVARRVVEDFNVDIINDISGGELDAGMFDVITALNVPYILMHIKGSPQTMQNNPNYKKDVVYEIIDYFAEKTERLKEKGLHDIIIDPGFGFGKTLDNNYEILNRLNEFDVLGLPMLVGISRKSMIYKLLKCKPEHALNGTTALNILALDKGASFLRVHDVKEAKECIELYNKMQSLKTN